MALKNTTCNGWKLESSLAMAFITANARVAKSMNLIPCDINCLE